MATTTVRLDDDDDRLLDELSLSFGGRSNAIRQAIRRLAVEAERQRALTSFLAEWEQEEGPVDEQAVAAMAHRYGL